MQGKQKLKASMKEHRDEISSLQVSKSNTECISSSFDGSCIIWDLVNFTRIRAMFLNTQFHDLKMHPDESQMIACGTDRKISYWDREDGELIRNQEGSDPGPSGGCITSLDISTHDGGVSFASGSQDRLVKSWRYDEGETAAIGEGHSGDILAVRISPDGQKIISVGQEGAIFVWTMPEMEGYDEE
jgi:WD40 repeat protein